MNLLKDAHTSIFSGQTKCGKTHLVLNLLESEYRHHFEYIAVICPTLRWNKTYLTRSWIRSDPGIFLIEPGDKLFEWIGVLSMELLSGYTTLFILDDVIADESLDKRRQSLLDLAISGRHRDHYLWLLSQSYTAIPKNLRRQVKQLFIWYPKERNDLRLIHEENEVLTNEELPLAKDKLKKSKYACLFIRVEYPQCWVIINGRSNKKP